MKAVVVMTQQKNKTFYTSPQMDTKKQTADFKQDLSDVDKDYCSLNPNSQKCKSISKKI